MFLQKKYNILYLSTSLVQQQPLGVVHIQLSSLPLRSVVVKILIIFLLGHKMNNHFFFQSSINSTHFSIVSLVFFFGSCFFGLAILVTEFGGSRITTFVDTRSGHHVNDKRIHIRKLYFIVDASTVDSE